MNQYMDVMPYIKADEAAAEQLENWVDLENYQDMDAVEGVVGYINNKLMAADVT